MTTPNGFLAIHTISPSELLRYEEMNLSSQPGIAWVVNDEESRPIEMIIATGGRFISAIHIRQKVWDQTAVDLIALQELVEGIEFAVIGPGAATVGNFAIFANAGGSELADGGTPGTMAFATAADYSTTAEIVVVLDDYLLSADLAGILADYVLIVDLATILEDYVTETALGVALGDYVLTATLTVTLADYYTETEADALLAAKQASDADLTALAALGSTGIAVRSAADTWVQRSIAVTASTGLQVTNGDGVAGNPTLAGLDANTTTKGVSEFANLTEYRVGTDTARSLVVDQVWLAAALAALTDGATIAVDLSTGFNFGGASNAVLGLGGNRTLGAPTNLKTGQTGILWFGAVTSTRTLTLNAAWLLMDDVEAGPYSITTSQILGIAYWVRGSVVYVTGILRRAA